MRFNVPGRLIDFYKGGQAYHDYATQVQPKTTRELGADELALFAAVTAGREIRPSMGGYYVRAELSSEAVEALRYWAETLETASRDNASDEPDARLDLRAAQQTIARLTR